VGDTILPVAKVVELSYHRNIASITVTVLASRVVDE